MNDTSPEIAKKLQELMMQRSGEERMMMAFDMFSMARALLTERLKSEGYHGAELRQQIFLHTYRHDFSAEAIDKICEKLAQFTD